MLRDNAYVFQKINKIYHCLAIIYDVSDPKNVYPRILNDEINVVYNDFNYDVFKNITLFCLNDKYYQITFNGIIKTSVPEIVSDGCSINFLNCNHSINSHESDDFEEIAY